MNEVQVSEAQKPDSGLRSVQQEMSHRDQMIGWLACLNWLVDREFIKPGHSEFARQVMNEVLRESGR